MSLMTSEKWPSGAQVDILAMPAEMVGVGMLFAWVDGKTLSVQIVEAEAAGVADDEARGLGDDQVVV